MLRVRLAHTRSMGRWGVGVTALVWLFACSGDESTATCGNGVCEPAETADSCARDCEVPTADEPFVSIDLWGWGVEDPELDLLHIDRFGFLQRFDVDKAIWAAIEPEPPRVARFLTVKSLFVDVPLIKSVPPSTVVAPL